jgi:CRP/FNR family transcriptional regulator, cyclic AMP receptor protein
MTADSGQDEQSRLFGRFGRRFAAGEVIFEAESPATEAYLLQEGRVRLIKRSGSSERSIRVVRPGDIFGEQGLVAGVTRTSTAVALVESAAIVLDPGTFEHLLAGNPAVGMRVLSQLIRRLREAEDQIEVLMLGDSQLKIAAALLQLCQEATRGPDAGAQTVTLSVSPMELSSRVGLDVDTVKRNVQQLRTNGYLKIDGERIVVPDIDSLRELRRLLDMKTEIAGSAEAGKPPKGSD